MYETIIKDIEVDGVSGWVWPRNDKGLWQGPSNEWIHHKEKLIKLCAGKNTVVQAGGACGMYPKLLSRMFQTVYTFEPDHYNFFCLVQNCIESNIIKFNCALGDRHRNVTFHPPEETNRGTGVVTSPVNDDKEDWKGNVPILRVDDFVYEKLDLIYLDVEGAEVSILRGAMLSIRTHKPIVVCENAHAGAMDLLLSEDYIITDKIGADSFFKHKSL